MVDYFRTSYPMIKLEENLSIEQLNSLIYEIGTEQQTTSYIPACFYKLLQCYHGQHSVV